jgi:glyceraldehyde-3-phosphate dehydrogenase (NADP+)
LFLEYSQVNALKGGLPWEKGVSITPLPQQGKVEVMLALIEDALEQGAKVINSKEG